MTDFEIGLAEQTFKPGTYTFRAVNDGQAPHALEVEGLGLEEATDILRQGQSADLTVTLSEGSYILYCPVGNHRDLGMETKITVGSAESKPAGSTPEDGGSGY